MELIKWFTKKAKKQILTNPKKWLLLFEDGIGYRIRKEGVYVHIESYRHETIFLPISSFNYSYEELLAFQKVGYQTDLRSSKKSIKRDVYCVKVSNGEENLVIESINPRMKEEIMKQVEALGYIKDRKVRYENESIELRDSYSINSHTKKVKFRNIVEYKQTSDVVNKVNGFNIEW